MLKLRAKAQGKVMLNAQHYAQVSASSLMLTCKVQEIGLSSGLKVKAKTQSPKIKRFAECNP